MKVDELFDGWWTVRPDGPMCKHFCWQAKVEQIHTGEPRNIEDIVPFPKRTQAQARQYLDMLPAYWRGNLAVYADHCLGCGAWAKVLAFDSAYGRAWRVTECERCGIIDSRDHSCFS